MDVDSCNRRVCSQCSVIQRVPADPAAEGKHAREKEVSAGHHPDLLVEAELGDQLTGDAVDLHLGERLTELEPAESDQARVLDRWGHCHGVHSRVSSWGTGDSRCTMGTWSPDFVFPSA